jgi:5-methylcytosine-specific restriction endonuclease McrA
MKKNKKISKKTRENWRYLVTHFTPEYIETMTDKKEYVVGWGSDNKSFCYLVEVGTKELGEIRGANSSKFGLWYGTHGEDKEIKYRATKQHFNCSVNKAFEDIKIALAKLIRETRELTEFKDLESLFSGMFKYKIMYLYNPSIMIPCFLLEDLQYFEEYLIGKSSKTFENAQKALIKYKDKHFSKKDNHDFMIFLYSIREKYNVIQTKELNEEADNKLNKKLSKEKESTYIYITHPVDKVSLKKGTGGGLYYPRDVKMAAIALKNANYKCEANSNHKCFLRKSNGMPYTEVHHLIPLAYHYKFDKSIDIPENIVSLCSNCHNEIHYGRDANKMIKKLFNKRKKKLHEAGVDVSIKELFEMYHKISGQK